MTHPLYFELRDDTYFMLQTSARRFTRAGYEISHHELARDLLQEMCERRPEVFRELLREIAQREEVFPNLT